MADEREFDANLKKSIEAFRSHIWTYQATLKLQGTCLLLATLGCRSVPAGPFRWSAYAIVLIVFGDRLKDGAGDTRSFVNVAEAIGQQVESSPLAEDARKARLGDIKEVQDTELGTKVTVRLSRIFLLCWVFYGLSVAASTIWSAAA